LQKGLEPISQDLIMYEVAFEQLTFPRSIGSLSAYFFFHEKNTLYRPKGYKNLHILKLTADSIFKRKAKSLKTEHDSQDFQQPI
jgi:hypothetical protein